jgi:hypothetical protein
VGFLIDEMVLGQFFLEVFLFDPLSYHSATAPHSYTFIWRQRYINLDTDIIAK